MAKRELDVGEWQYARLSEQDKLKRVAERRLPALVKQRAFSARGIGLVGTLLMHTLALQTVYLNARAHRLKPPDEQGLGATLIKAEVPPAETLILIDLPNIPKDDRSLQQGLSSLGSEPMNAVITILSTNALPHVQIPRDNDSDHSAADAADSSDIAARAAMFGRYTGQVDARILRAWLKPRAAVNSDVDSQAADAASHPPDFNCQVRIIQGKQGQVREIQLLSCNGNTAWQKSLVAAILMASPLPAPPDPNVFTEALTMTFTASAYTPGNSADGYERD